MMNDSLARAAQTGNIPDLAKYLAMGADATQRGKVYGEWLRHGIGEDDLAAIRLHVQQERALGNPRFQRLVEKTLNRPAGVRPRGRPRKSGPPTPTHG